MAINDPMFAHFPEHDSAITEWLSQRGWPVTGRYFDYDRDTFAWRHEGVTGNRTIRITQATVEDYPAQAIIALFDSARVAEVLEKHPGKYVILRRQSGGIGFDVLDGPPNGQDVTG